MLHVKRYNKAIVTVIASAISVALALGWIDESVAQVLRDNAPAAVGGISAIVGALVYGVPNAD